MQKIAQQKNTENISQIKSIKMKIKPELSIGKADWAKWIVNSS